VFFRPRISQNGKIGPAGLQAKVLERNGKTEKAGKREEKDGKLAVMAQGD